MSARVSRGCLRCRTRRVKCDEGRPSCQRCLKRCEVCTGYRDDTTLLFRSENEKAARPTISRRRASFESLRRSEGSSKASISPLLQDIPNLNGPSELTTSDNAGPNISNPFPWAKSVPAPTLPSTEDQAVSEFFEKFVMYPCNNGSSPGFLEHLPALFKESPVEGRLSLRWAVRAAAYAGLSNKSDSPTLGNKALECYGQALTALGAALRDPKRALDDYTLMTIVMLDLFETIYLQGQVNRGYHTEGIAHVLRLRGPDQIYSPRGWSLFRLSHHRLQKEQLAFKKAPLPESMTLFDALNDELPNLQLEKNNYQISQTCEKARSLLKSIDDSEHSVNQTLEMIREMHALDQITTTWRAGSRWSYKTIHRSEISRDEKRISHFPEFVQLHQDVWIAYEWNYHRTARIILHEHLLECLNRLQTLSSTSDSSLSSDILKFKEISISVIRLLLEEILSTVPQSLGDISNEGVLLEDGPGTWICTGLGGYFLLWPIKVIKATPHGTMEQIEVAKNVFERIRDCTGMKSFLGDASCI